MKKHAYLSIVVVAYMSALSLAAQPFVQPEALEYSIKNMPFNGKGDDFAPILSQQGLIYTHYQNSKHAIWKLPLAKNLNSDLYLVPAKNGKLSNKSQKMGINTRLSEIAGSYSPKNNKLYLTRQRPAAKSSKSGTVEKKWSLYETEYNYQRWSKPILCKIQQNGTATAFASVSEDGQTIYFSADAPGGYGGLDIYVTQKLGGSWRTPINLGPSVNSVGDEIYPFIRPNGVLYFASNGKQKSNFDIYYTTPATQVLWNTPIALPQPINSADDDFAIIFDNNTDNGYFTSNRSNGKGGCDVYSFGAANQPMLLPNSPNLYSQDNENNLIKTVRNEWNYELITRTNELNDGLNLNKIQFYANGYRLNPTVKSELDKVAAFMNQNSQITIEIATYTSYVGEGLNNLQLCVKRANEIKTYLQQKNIRTERLSARGYGESNPINACNEHNQCSEAEIYANERVIFRIVSGNLTPPTRTWAMTTAPNMASSQQPTLQTVSNRTNSNAKTTATDLADNTPSYKVSVGPFETIDNRLFDDYNLSGANIKIENSPHGKMVVLGTYKTAQEANQLKAEIEREKGTKAQVSVTMPVNAYQKSVAKKNNGYKVMAGPFKHVGTEIYQRFNQIAPARIANTPTGTMIVMDGFATQSDAERCKDAAWVQIDKKMSVSVYDPNNKLLKIEKKK